MTVSGHHTGIRRWDGWKIRQGLRRLLETEMYGSHLNARTDEAGCVRLSAEKRGDILESEIKNCLSEMQQETADIVQNLYAAGITPLWILGENPKFCTYSDDMLPGASDPVSCSVFGEVMQMTGQWKKGADWCCVQQMSQKGFSGYQIPTGI